MLKDSDYTIEAVISIAKTYMNDEHIAFIQEAYDYAEKAHEGQFRKSGEPYIDHPVQVAGVLAELKMDPATVATGFLHDIVEDTEITLNDLIEKFSPTVATLVDGVTKLGKYQFNSKEEEQAENHRKMLLAMADDIRVILVKLADRLHNMRTLEFHRPDKQRRIARETLEIYAPLADRLGISRIKWELEDISLRYINPQQYYRIVHLMNSRREEREEYINRAIEEIDDNLDELGIEGTITGRPKHIYSIYRKMKEQRKQFDEIYDLQAVRVITESISDCYAILGAIHAKWKPIPGRFKDYIAVPKENLYQSLHTTVLGPNGTTLEVQIRTEEMHEVAEFGVAAHWAYKEGQTQKVQASDLDKELSIFRDILEMQSETDNTKDFMEGIKEDVLRDKVYVFTPENDVVELPQGASTLDFAYNVHTEVGNKATGAKVNGRIVPLNYKLKNGDIVYIVTSKTSYGPSRDWLKYVSTSKARNRIKRFFKVQDKEKNIEVGRDILEKLILDEGFKPKEVLTKKALETTLDRFNFNDTDELYSGLGYGEIRSQTVVNYILKEPREAREKEEQIESVTEISESKPNEKQSQSVANEKMRIKHDGGVTIEGGNNLLVHLSRCCNPVPGDKIVGYITKGRGISVHRSDCPNVSEKAVDTNRLIDVEWDDSTNEEISYNAELLITGYDRTGLFNEISQVFNSGSKSVNISNIKADVDHSTQIAEIRLTLAVTNTEEIEIMVSKIKTVPDVYSVSRYMS